MPTSFVASSNSEPIIQELIELLTKSQPLMFNELKFCVYGKFCANGISTVSISE
ncbi:MAG: hypothetical protein II298_03415 [Bacteroidales bacterium]|nr:hypothetical protein [Bacteroidales bacterium]